MAHVGDVYSQRAILGLETALDAWALPVLME